MADASLTVTPVKVSVFGDVRAIFADVAFTGNYRTGGVALTPANVGLQRILGVNCFGAAPAADQATANSVAYNHATDKFVLWEGSAAGTALSEKTDNEAVATGQVFRVLVFGLGY